MLVAHKIFNEIYDDPEFSSGDFYKNGGYSYAIHACKAEKGTLIYNSNDDNSAVSFAPTLRYQFDDNSILRIDYSGVTIELDPERVKRIRRRVEDRLRKDRQIWKLLEIATDLNVSLD